MLAGGGRRFLTCIKRSNGSRREDSRMHYHYFTIEQRNTLADAMRSRIAEPGMKSAFERLHTPEFGVCETCGGDIAFTRLTQNPRLRRCPACLSAL
jgi:RNA polymerase-binding transcription factor DksA